MSNPIPIAEHLHHAILRMPSTTVLGDLDKIGRFRFDRQAGRHLDAVEALAVQVFPLASIDDEPSVFVVVEDNEGPVYGVYSVRALAEEHIRIMSAHSPVGFHIEVEPLRNAIDPLLAVAEGEEG